MAEVLPFPLHRRAGLIRKQAAWFVEQESRKGAENNLARLLTIQREALVNKGVDHAEAAEQAKQLEAAIRAAAWRYMLTTGEVG